MWNQCFYIPDNNSQAQHISLNGRKFSTEKRIVLMNSLSRTRLINDEVDFQHQRSFFNFIVAFPVNCLLLLAFVGNTSLTIVIELTYCFWVVCVFLSMKVFAKPFLVFNIGHGHWLWFYSFPKPTPHEVVCYCWFYLSISPLATA